MTYTYKADTIGVALGVAVVAFIFVAFFAVFEKSSKDRSATVWFNDVGLEAARRSNSMSYQRFPIPRNEDGTTYDIGFRDDGVVVWRKLE